MPAMARHVRSLSFAKIIAQLATEPFPSDKRTIADPSRTFTETPLPSTSRTVRPQPGSLTPLQRTDSNGYHFARHGDENHDNISIQRCNWRVSRPTFGRAVDWVASPSTMASWPPIFLRFSNNSHCGRPVLREIQNVTLSVPHSRRGQCRVDCCGDSRIHSSAYHTCERSVKSQFRVYVVRSGNYHLEGRAMLRIIQLPSITHQPLALIVERRSFANGFSFSGLSARSYLPTN